MAPSRRATNITTPIDALRLLAEAEADRADDLSRYAKQAPDAESDDEADAESPILDSFVESGGPNSIHTLTNFSLVEFHEVYDRLRKHISDNYNVGRGKRSQFKGKDVFFMTMTVLKHSGQWDFLAKVFNVKGPTFERLVIGFIKMLSDFAYAAYVEQAAEQFDMTTLLREKSKFNTFGMARYATDVTFQQSQRPRGNMEEGKSYYSGKHKLYGYKTEVSVLPNGLALGCSDHFVGSTADIDIFYKGLAWHKSQLRKSTEDREVTDVGPGVDRFPRYWAVLMDKGYQGAAEQVRAIIPAKKPKGNDLSRRDIESNKKIASDRIIVENFFGRQCTLWTVVANKYRWAEGSYDPIFKLTVALTNAHILRHPLRAEDGDLYWQLVNRRVEIVENTVGKRRRSQQRYVARRKARLSQRLSRPALEEGGGAMHDSAAEDE